VWALRGFRDAKVPESDALRNWTKPNMSMADEQIFGAE
jgi:hypothetical protein